MNPKYPYLGASSDELIHCKGLWNWVSQSFLLLGQLLIPEKKDSLSIFLLLVINLNFTLVYIFLYVYPA